jgi:hypothetical protein
LVNMSAHISLLESWFITETVQTPAESNGVQGL